MMDNFEFDHAVHGMVKCACCGSAALFAVNLWFTGVRPKAFEASPPAAEPHDRTACCPEKHSFSANRAAKPPKPD
ncbi:MAG TPA: hypothetical protein VLI65_00870 [Pyrinomonadaceae bacterium]|nr:hypothetical protein [Pyrinomonadaceae bacterium]